MRRLRLIAVVVSLLLGSYLVAPASAQGRFWVLVNGALRYTGVVTITGPLAVGTTVVPATNTLSQSFVGGGGMLGQTGAGGDFDVCWNCYYNSGFKYRITDVAGKFGFNTVASGDWSIQTAGSGSADAAISFAERLRVSGTTGNVSANTGWGLGSSQVLMISATAPSISSGFGSTPSIASNNGTAAFTINVGTGGTAQTGVIGLPTATTGWRVNCDDVTTKSATVYLTKQTATSTTSATIGLFDAAGAAAAWAASDILVCDATAY